jgi:hypothetical protein
MGSNSLCTHGERGTRGKRHWGRKGLGRGRGIGRARNGAVRSAGVTLEAAGGRIQHWIQRAWVSPVESECQQAKPGQKRGRGRKGGRVGIGGGAWDPEQVVWEPGGGVTHLLVGWGGIRVKVRGITNCAKTACLLRAGTPGEERCHRPPSGWWSWHRFHGIRPAQKSSFCETKKFTEAPRGGTGVGHGGDPGAEEKNTGREGQWGRRGRRGH